jgi:integrase
MIGTRPLTDLEARKVLESADSARDKLLILCGLHFGLRISESLSLKFKDLSGEYLSVRSLKNSRNQVYPITPEIKAAFEALKAEYQGKGFSIDADTAVFKNRSGVRMTRQAASNLIKKISAKQNMTGKINTHSLRKTFISKIYAATGKDMVETMNYSRHKTLNSIGHYLQSNGDTSLVMNLKY